MPNTYVRLAIGAALAATMAIAGAATAALPTPVNGQITDGVTAIDANHNGAVDRDEWKEAGQRTFDALDTDNDGWVSPGEFAVLHGVMFAVIDGDRDGKMTPEEIDAYKRLPWTLGVSR